MKGTVRAMLAVLLATASQTAVFATETGTLSCKGGIVSIGDTTGEVVGKCGQPATTATREDLRVEGGAKSGRDRIIRTTTVDDWLFNFGPDQFQYRLLLENGRVTRIESLGYGY